MTVAGLELASADALAICGTYPPGIPATCYRDLTAMAVSYLMSGKTSNAVCTEFSCGITSCDGISGIDVDYPVVRPCDSRIFAVIPEGTDFDAPFIPFGCCFGKVSEIGGVCWRSEKLLVGDGQLFILDSFSDCQM